MGKPIHRPSGKSNKKQSRMEFPINPELLGTILLSLILILISVIRIRLLSFPLERDEGEYAYFGQLILDGVPPYKTAYNLKLPGTYYCYALIMAVFGQTMEGIRIGLLFFNLGSLIFLYLTVKKLFNVYTALIACTTTGLLFVSPSVFGQAAHASHFVTFFMLGGTWLLVKALEKNSSLSFIFSGVMMGLAFLMKQSGIFFSIFGGVMIILHYFITRSHRFIQSAGNLAVYSAGVLIPLVLIFVILFWSGVFDKFWFWTMTYPTAYGSRIPISKAWSSFMMFFPSVYISFQYLWIAAALGFLTLFIKKERLWSRVFVIIFVLFSFFPVIPGFYFRPHYFVTFLPAVGILTGLIFNFLNTLTEKYFKQIWVITSAIFIVLVIHGIITLKDFFFTKNPMQVCTLMYEGKNLFSESIPIARFIQSNTSEKDVIFVCGSEPQIYFYAQRKAATGYIYMYDLVYDHRYVDQMRSEMFKEVEEAYPKYIVLVSCPYSWLAKSSFSEPVLSWINKYIKEKNYVVTGVADFLHPQPTIYLWNDEARDYKIQSKMFMMVLRRPD